MNEKMTAEQEKDLYNVAMHYSYRIVFGVFETDGFHIYAEYNRRKLNQFKKLGYAIFLVCR